MVVQKTQGTPESVAATPQPAIPLPAFQPSAAPLAPIGHVFAGVERGVHDIAISFMETVDQRMPQTGEDYSRRANLIGWRAEHNKIDDPAIREGARGTAGLARFAAGEQRESEADLHRAQEARAGGDEAGAQRYEASAREHAETARTHMEEAMGKATGLRLLNSYQAGNPPEIIGAAGATFNDWGLANQGRAQLVAQDMQFVHDNQGLLESGAPGMRDTYSRILDHASALAESARRFEPFTPEMAQRFSQEFSQIVQPVLLLGGSLKGMETALANIMQMQRDAQYKAVVGDALDELKKLLARIDKGEEVKEEEKAKAFETASYISDADSEIEGMPADAKAGAGKMIIRGIAALRAGKRAEAAVQRELARALAQAKDPEQKEAIERASAWLSVGKLDALDVGNMLERGGDLRKLDSMVLGGRKQYGAEVAEIRAIDKQAAALMKKADELREKAKLEKSPAKKKELEAQAAEMEGKAKGLLRTADAKTKGLLEIAKIEKELRASGAPEPVIKAVRATYRFFGTASQWRANAALAASRFFLDNKDVLKDPKAAPILGALVKFLGALGGQKKDSEIGGREKAEAYVKNDIEPKISILDARMTLGALEKAGAPKILADGLRAATRFFGTKDDWRGRTVLKAAKFFLANRARLESPQGKGVLGGLLNLVANAVKGGMKEADAPIALGRIAMDASQIPAAPAVPVSAPQKKPGAPIVLPAAPLAKPEAKPAPPAPAVPIIKPSKPAVAPAAPIARVAAPAAAAPAAAAPRQVPKGREKAIGILESRRDALARLLPFVSPELRAGIEAEIKKADDIIAKLKDPAKEVTAQDASGCLTSMQVLEGRASSSLVKRMDDAHAAPSIVSEVRAGFSSGDPLARAKALADAEEFLRKADAVLATAKLLEEADAPQQLVDAVKSSVALIGTDLEGRAARISDAAYLFLGSGRLLSGRDGEGILSDIVGFAIVLADPEKSVDMNKADERLKSIRADVAQKADERRASALDFLKFQKNRLMLLLPRASGPLRESVEQTIKDTDAAIARLEDPQTASDVGDDELERLQLRVLEPQAIMEGLGSLEPDSSRYKEISRVYAAGLDLLRAGGNVEDYKLIKFAATQLEKRPGSAAYRGSVVRDAEEMGKDPSATTPERKADARAGLVRSLAGPLAADLAEAGRGQGYDIQLIFAKMKRKVEGFAAHPETVTSADLERAAAAVEIGKGMRISLKPGRNVPQPLRDEATAIYGRALVSLDSGGDAEAAKAQQELAGIYLTADNDDERQEIESVSKLLLGKPEELPRAQAYLQLSKRSRHYREEARRLGKSPAAATLLALADDLDAAKKKLAQGLGLATESVIKEREAEIRKAAAKDPRIGSLVASKAQELMGANPGMDEEQATEAAVHSLALEQADSEEQDRLGYEMDAADAMLAALARPGHGEKKDICGIYGLAISAFVGGGIDDGLLYRDAADAYMKLPGARDRQGILEDAQNYHDKLIDRAGAADIFAVYQQRAIYESGIVDRGTLTNATAYFDLALIAARGKNRVEAKVMLDMAVGYARMGVVPAAGLPPDMQERRAQGMAFIEKSLGDYRKDRDLASGKRLIDIGAGGRKGWMPKPGAMMPPQAAALLSDYAGQTNGEDDSARAGRVAGLEKDFAPFGVSSDMLGFEQRALAISGAGGRERGRAEKKYAEEKLRLERAAKHARERHDEQLAAYYEWQAGIADRAFVTSSLDAGRDLVKRGEDELGLALEATGQADGLELAGLGTPGGMAAFARRVVRGDKDAIDALAAMPADAQAAVMGLAGNSEFKGAAIAADDEFGAFVAKMSVEGGQVALAAEAMDSAISAKRQEAAAHAQNGRGLIHSASRIMDGLEAFDTSVRRVDTVHRESGRFELQVGVNTYITISSGFEADSFGKAAVAEETAGAGEIVRKPIKLSPQRARAAAAAAERELGTGINAVAVERRIQRRRDAGLETAKREILFHDVEQAKALLNGMILFLPEGERKEWVERVDKAAALAIVKNDFKGLEAIYSEIGTRLQLRTHDAETHRPLFDMAKGGDDYRKVVGLWWAERFGAASVAGGRARFDIDSGYMRANNRVTGYARRRDISDATAGPEREDAEEGKAVLDYPVGSPRHIVSLEFLEEVITHLPPDQQDAYRKRLARIPRDVRPQEAGFSELLEVDTALGMNYPGLYSKVLMGEPLYYNEDYFDGAILSAQHRAQGGDIAGASEDLGDIGSGMVRADSAQQADTRRLRNNYLAWKRHIEGNGRTAFGRSALDEEFLEPDPAESEDSPAAREARHKRNDRIAKRLDLLRAGYQRDEDELRATAGAEEISRDAIRQGADILGITPDLVALMFGGLDADSRAKYQDGMEAVISAGNPEDRQKRAQELYLSLRADPDAFAKGVAAVRENGYYVDKVPPDAAPGAKYHVGILPQLEADGLEFTAAYHDQQRSVAWAYARKMIRDEGNQLRMRDSAASATGRAERDEATRLEEGRLGWAPYHTTDQAHSAYADKAQDLAEIALSPDNDYRFYDLAASGAGVPVLGAHGETRYIVKPAEELVDLDRRMARELTSYTSAADQGRARNRYDEEGVQRATLELGTMGFSLSFNPEGKYYEIAKADLDPERLDILYKAYGQFMALYDEQESTAMAHDTSMGTDAQEKFVDRMHYRMGFAYDAGNIALAKGHAGIGNARDAYEKSVPFERNDATGHDEDPDAETKSARKSMGKYMAVKRVGVTVVETGVSVGGIVAAPATGGASLVLTMGVGAYQTLGAVDEAIAYGRLTTGTALNIAMGAATTLLPVGGALYRGAGEGALLLISTGEGAVGARIVSGVGLAMIPIGFVQYAAGFPDMWAQYKAGEMPVWELVAYGAMQGLQGVQVGLSAYRGARMARTGVPAYRPRWLQVVEAVTMGEEFDSATQHRLARAYAAADREFRRLPQPARISYESYVSKLAERGIELPPQTASAMLEGYGRSVAGNPGLRFEDYALNDPAFRSAAFGSSDPGIVPAIVIQNRSAQMHGAGYHESAADLLDGYGRANRIPGQKAREARELVLGAERILVDGADPALVFPDNPPLQKAAIALASDPAFIRATASGWPDRAGQMIAALEIGGAVPVYAPSVIVGARVDAEAVAPGLINMEETAAQGLPDGPAKDAAIKAAKGYVDGECAAILHLPEAERPAAIARVKANAEFIIERAAADPANATAWAHFASSNPELGTYAAQVHDGGGVSAHDAEFRPAELPVGEPAVARTLAKRFERKPELTTLAGNLPEGWLYAAGVERENLRSLVASDPAKAAETINRVLKPHNMVLVQNNGFYLAEVTHTIAPPGSATATGFVIGKVYGLGDMFAGRDAMYNLPGHTVFLKGKKAYSEGGIPAADIPVLRERYAHESQHLRDHAAGLMAAHSRASAGRGMAGMPDFKAGLETTAVAREVGEMLYSMDGAQVGKFLDDALLSKRQPPEYKAAYERSMKALSTDENGAPDPDWRTRPPEVLRARLDGFIEAEYIRMVGIGYSHLYEGAVGELPESGMPKEAVAKPETGGAAELARRAVPKNVVGSDALMEAVLEMAGAGTKLPEWIVGGERVREGGVESFETGGVLRTIEDIVVNNAAGGVESDIIVISADKKRLNGINDIFGLENGDLALGAYRDILQRATAMSAGGEFSIMIRPSSRGDEVIAVIVVKKGSGERVRAEIGANVLKATNEVFAERNAPGTPGFIGDLARVLRNPRDVVAASVLVGPVVEVRKVEGVVRANYHDDGNAYITRAGGTVEFLAPAATKVDDPYFAADLRKLLGIGEQHDIVKGLEPAEELRLLELWERRGGPLTPEDSVTVARMMEAYDRRRAEGAGPDIAARDMIALVAAERVNVAPGEILTNGGVAFEIRYELPEPVRNQLLRLLPEVGKGLAEAINNSFGIRGFNTDTGHYAANSVVSITDGAVAEFGRANGVRIRRLGTMKYYIEGGTPEMAAKLCAHLDAVLKAKGLDMKVSGKQQPAAIGPGTDGRTALAHVSNGHLVVERRRLPRNMTEEQAGATDWDGHTEHYQNANALISLMSLGSDETLIGLVGQDNFARLEPIIKLVREHPEIRNFEDLVFALRDTGYGGENGTALEGLFRGYVVDNGNVLRSRLDGRYSKPAAGEEGAAAEAVPLPAGPEAYRKSAQAAREAGMDAEAGLFELKADLADDSLTPDDLRRKAGALEKAAYDAGDLSPDLRRGRNARYAAEAEILREEAERREGKGPEMAAPRSGIDAEAGAARLVGEAVGFEEQALRARHGSPEYNDLMAKARARRKDAEKLKLLCRLGELEGAPGTGGAKALPEKALDEETARDWVVARAGFEAWIKKAVPPELRAYALETLGFVMDRGLEMIAKLPSGQRPSEAGRLIVAVDYIVGRAADNPARAKAWFDYARMRAADQKAFYGIIDYAMLAKRGLRLSDEGMSVENIDVTAEDAAVRRSLEAKFGRMYEQPAAGIALSALPERYLADAGLDVGGLTMGLEDPLRRADAVEKINAALAPHGLVLVDKGFGFVLAEVSHIITLHGQADTRAYIITKAYGPEAVFDSNVAGFFSRGTGEIFLRANPEADAAGIWSGGARIKSVYLHELQHFFDNVSGFGDEIRRKFGNDSARIVDETTAIAREAIINGPEEGGRIAGLYSRSFNPVYRDAAGRVRAAIAGGRLDGLLDLEYNAALGLGFGELFEAGPIRVVSGEIGTLPPRKAAAGEMHAVSADYTQPSDLEDFVRRLTSDDRGIREEAEKELEALGNDPEAKRIIEMHERLRARVIEREHAGPLIGKSRDDFISYNAHALGEEYAPMIIRDRRDAGVKAEAPAVMEGGQGGSILAAEDIPGKYDAASMLRLDEPGELAAFARKVVLGDAPALERFGSLPPEIRDIVAILTQDETFRGAARSDFMFKSYVEDPHGLGKRMVDETAGAIRGIIRKPAEAGPASPVHSPEAAALAEDLASSPMRLSDLVRGLIKGEPDALAELETLGSHPARKHVESLADNPDIRKVVLEGGLPDLDLVRVYSKAIVDTLHPAESGAPAMSGAGVLPATADSGISGYFDKAASGDEAALSVLVDRYSGLDSPGGAFDAMLLREIDLEAKRTGLPRRDAAKSVLGALLSKPAGDEALAIAGRVKANSAGAPTVSDIALARLIIREGDRFAANEFAPFRKPAIDGLAVIASRTPGSRLASAIESFDAAARQVSAKFPQAGYRDSIMDSAAQKVFRLAAELSADGAQTPAAMISSGRSGLLDLFPLTSPQSFVVLGDAADIMLGMLARIPDFASFKIQTKGQIVKAEVSRGEIGGTLFNWLLGDMARLKEPGAREVYLRKFDSLFTWDGFSAQYKELLMRAAKSSKSVGTVDKLPLLAYVVEDQSGTVSRDLILKTLDVDFFRARLGPDANYRAFIGFLENIHGVGRENNKQSKRWLEAAKESLEFLNLDEAGRKKAGIAEKQKDSRKYFIEKKMAYLNELLALFREGEVNARALIYLAEGVIGKPAKEDFEKALAEGYLDVFGNDMNLGEEYVLAHTALYLEVSAYRKNLRGFTGEPTPQMNSIYVGDKKAFKEGIPILDAAFRAEAEGGFAVFKFSEEFHDELRKSFGPGNEAAADKAFESWKSDGRGVVEAGGKAYELEEASSFEELFHAGIYRGEVACQNPKNSSFVVAGLVGMVELPWMKEVIVSEAGGAHGAYKRWVVLVKDSGTGRPVLLVQPGYGQIGPKAEVDAALIAMLKAKYEPLGIEVRDMPKPETREKKAVRNYGYRTYASGRSPFFYIDSNMYTFPDVGGITQMHGLHNRVSGKEVIFDKGWERDHRVKW